MKPSIWYIVIGVIIGFGVGVGYFLSISDVTEITTQAQPSYFNCTRCSD